MQRQLKAKLNSLVLILMLGLSGFSDAARYVGWSAADAGRVIQASQGVRGWNFSALGHPWGHASHPGETDPIGSVENYSSTSTSLADAKSGFDSRNTMNVVGHAALSTRRAQDAFSKLNAGSAREVIQVPWSELSGVPTVRMARWVKGARWTDWLQPRSLTLVLQHHLGQQNNPNADVHVHTFYPRDN